MTDTSRPLVTFALFAYNQEKCIREAVEGAFAQTYKPLEIILSDDCSTDETFNIMMEMAVAYTGPHRVMVRKNDHNLRPYSHVLEVVKVCKGSLVILAAGDDVSKPDRSNKIFDASQSSDAWAFHSRYDVIDENAQLLSLSQRSEGLFSRDSEFNKYFDKEDGAVHVVHGATSAYRRELLEMAPANDCGILSEDGVFTILLNMIGKEAMLLEDSLVLYRTHSQAISNTSFNFKSMNVESCRFLLERQQLYAKNIADRAGLALKFQDDSSQIFRPLNAKYLRDEIAIQSAKFKWRDLSFRQRLKALSYAIQLRRIGYILPSILGAVLGPRYLYLRYRLRRARVS
jgi:glycosyltransferase involved in cell wall biosynthesis